MTVVADMQFELSPAGLLFGDGALGEVRAPWPRGFVGTPKYRARDLARSDGVGGSMLGVTDVDVRVLQIPLQLESGLASDAERVADVATMFRPIAAGWASLADVVEHRLDCQLPGTPHTVMSYFGEPREIEEPAHLQTLGAIHVDLTFLCSDPYLYGPEESASSSDGQLELTHVGTVTSKRLTIVATTAGATGTITNLDDPDGGTMTFAGLEDATITIDLAGDGVSGPAVTGAGGAVRDGTLRNDSGWPYLVPGANRLAFTGFTQLAATWRAAYR